MNSITIPAQLLPPPNLLEKIAIWIDSEFPDGKCQETKRDLEQWAYNLREYGVNDVEIYN